MKGTSISNTNNIQKLNQSQIDQSQELVGYMMEIIDGMFLERSAQSIVLEIRKVLTLYDENGNRNDLNIEDMKNLSWLY